MIALVPIAWASVLVLVAWSHRPVPSRRPTVRSDTSRRSLVAPIGTVVLAVVGRPADAVLSQRVGRSVVAALLFGLLSPFLALPAGMAAWVQPVVAERRRRRSDASLLLRELPDVVDLFRLATSAGLTVPLAVGVVAKRAGGLLGPALAEAHDRAELGEPLADSLDRLRTECGEGAGQLVDVLTASLRYGVGLDEPLARVAADARRQRRRATEIAARRLPVKLLLPLVLCILPAFALLTIVPTLVSTLESLRR